MIPMLAHRVWPSTSPSPSPDKARRQEVVDDDVGAHRGRVVAELADLRRGLVDEAEVPLRGAHRLRPEQVVARTSGDEPLHRRFGEIEAVSTDVSPALSRPRTSSRSRAVRAWWTDVPTSMADHEGSGPISARTPVAVGSRSHITAHRASFRRSSAALASSRVRFGVAPSASSVASVARIQSWTAAPTAAALVVTSRSRTSNATPSVVRSSASSVLEQRRTPRRRGNRVWGLQRLLDARSAVRGPQLDPGRPEGQALAGGR